METIRTVEYLTSHGRESLKVSKRYSLCPQCDRLCADYDAASQEYIRTLQVLQKLGHTLSNQEHSEMRLTAANLRTRIETTRIALELHAAEHEDSMAATTS
jgi:hypothetical protein